MTLFYYFHLESLYFIVTSSLTSLHLRKHRPRRPPAKSPIILSFLTPLPLLAGACALVVHGLGH